MKTQITNQDFFLEILSKVTGIEIVDLEFKNEVQIIRPSEVLEAMDELKSSVGESLKPEILIEILNCQQEVISTPLRGEWVTVEDIKRIFAEHGIVIENPF